MKILLVSATKFEIAPLLKAFGNVRSGKSISSYRFGKHSVDVLITGVGMTSTAFCLGKNMSKKYELAINAGVAGSFRKNISLGEVVNVVSDCFAELGVEDGEKFLTAKEIGLSADFRFQNKSIRTISNVKAITVNAVHGNTSSIKIVVKKFNPDIETMEGAAFFFACKSEKIPCLQIRAISNYVEKRNKKKWKMNLAIKKLNLFLEKHLESI